MFVALAASRVQARALRDAWHRAEMDKIDAQRKESAALAAEAEARRKDAELRADVADMASFVAVASLTSNTSRRGVGQWGGAGGAICEDHLVFLRRVIGLKRLDSAGETRFVNSQLRHNSEFDI